MFNCKIISFLTTDFNRSMHVFNLSYVNVSSFDNYVHTHVEPVKLFDCLFSAIILVAPKWCIERIKLPVFHFWPLCINYIGPNVKYFQQNFINVARLQSHSQFSHVQMRHIVLPGAHDIKNLAPFHL